MKDIFQHNENLLYIERFQVFRLRANLMSFFKTLLENLFGQVDSKLSVYIPDLINLENKNSTRSISKYADIQESIVHVSKWWFEKDRKIPFVIINPGRLSEQKLEISGDNFHYQDSKGAVYGNAGDCQVVFVIGAEDDRMRTQIGDILYSCFTQFYRKNFIYFSDDNETMYSLTIKNDPISYGEDSTIDVSDFEKVYIVGVTISVFIEWNYTVDKSWFDTQNSMKITPSIK